MKYITLITRTNIHDSDMFPEGCFRSYRKKPLTRAARVHGKFVVETREGVLDCPDGYLAIDSQGWPYPIAKDEFEKIYELVD